VATFLFFSLVLNASLFIDKIIGVFWSKSQEHLVKIEYSVIIMHENITQDPSILPRVFSHENWYIARFGIIFKL
jgi:hypothetical protein